MHNATFTVVSNKKEGNIYLYYVFNMYFRFFLVEEIIKQKKKNCCFHTFA